MQEVLRVGEGAVQGSGGTVGGRGAAARAAGQDGAKVAGTRDGEGRRPGGSAGGRRTKRTPGR